MQVWARLVVGVIDQLGVTDATFVGASMGGYLAMAVLRHHPDRVRQLVLADAVLDDPGVAQRRTAQQTQLHDGTAPEVLAKETVEGLLSSGLMSRCSTWSSTSTPWRPAPTPTAGSPCSRR